MTKTFTFLFKDVGKKAALLLLFLSFVSYSQLQAQVAPKSEPATAKKNSVPILYTITGTVSGDGATIPGAIVRNKAADQAVITDANGVYKIGVSAPTDILTFSYLGYQNMDRVVGTLKQLNVTLISATNELKDVVIVGYGSTKKRDVTGAIVSITAEDIEKRAPTNVYEALQGQAAGVQVTSGSGQPGESASVVIRGTSTMNNDGIGPLWVVDGVPTTNVDAINPYDIASMEILKDAASAAIYGSRSANGVIIITTKKGSPKAPVIELRYLHSINELTHTLPQINSAQYRDLQKGLTQYINGEGKLLVPTAVQNVMASQIADSLNFLLNADNDYQALAFDPAHKNQLDMSIGGGSEKLKYFIGGGYLGEKGIISNTSYDRISSRLNADYIPNDKLTLGTRISVSYGKKKGIDEGGFLNSLLSRKPNLSLYYPDNSIIGTLWGNSPLALNLQTNFSDIYNASFYQMGEYKITKDLKFTSNINGVIALNRYNFMRPTLLSDGYLNNFGQHISTMNWNWLNENYLNYSKSINNTHNFTGLLGVSAQSWRLETDGYSGRNSATDAIYTQNAFAANFDLTRTGTTASAHTLASIFSRFTYNYKSRYLFTANLRADGSSRFAKDKKVGYFPSASAAWRFSDEPFMQWTKKLKVDDAKLRVSYGVTGNESIGDYESILSYGIGGIYDGVAGVTAARIAVDNLGWEQTSQANIGLDVTFAKNRFQLTVDYYNKETSNLLAAYEIPKEWGFNTVRKNIGSITNKGLEVAFGGDVIKNKKFTLNVAANVSFNKNRIKEIAGGIPYLFSDTWWISQGQPIGDFYGYKSLGIFAYDQSNAFSSNWEQLTPNFQKDASGQMIKDANGKYVLSNYTLNGATYTGTVNQKKLADGTPFRGGDVNWADSGEDTKGVGVITDKDRMVLGNAQPDFTGGFNFNLRYKTLSLFVASYFSIGGEIYNFAKYNLIQGSMNGLSTVPTTDFLNNYWIKQGDEVAYARPYSDRFQNARSVSSFYLEDASYLKIRNVRLSYLLPARWSSKAKLKGINVYGYVNNALTFTSYSGYDPEFSAYSALAIGTDTNRYPRKREFGFGLNLNFNPMKKILKEHKMKKTNSQLVGILLLALTITTLSCKKFLEVDPISEIPAAKMWQNQRDVNAGISEIYSSFRTALNSNYFSWGEMRSDNFVLFSEQPTENSKLILNQLTTDLPSSNWATLYKVISNTNFAIKYIPSSEITDANLKNDYLAQAYAMRALSYFYAVRVWGDVPVYLEPIDNIDKGEFRKRTVMKTVLRDVILADLKTAEQLINPSNVERKRISRQAIYAIQADVYMWLDDYDNADKTIDKLRSNLTTTNFQPDMATMKRTFVEDLNNKAFDNDPLRDEYGPGTNELIFVIHQNVAEAGLNNYSLTWLLLGSGSGQGSTVVLSPKLQATYNAAKAATPSDSRFDNYLAASGGGTTTYQVHKYIANGTSLAYQNFINCQMAYPVYRFTDVLLMQAECKAHLDKWQEALDIIRTTTRTRAGVAASTRALNTFSSRDQVIDYVLDERQIELVGEGKRWFDLVRNKRAVKVMKPINGMSNENQTLWPIHQSLINQNPSLVQNLDY